MTASGGSPTDLTEAPADDRNPAFSPSGQRIAFARNGVLFAMDDDGTAPAEVVGDAGLRGVPDWQPLDCTIEGSPAGETLSRTPGDDVICADGGDDVIRNLGTGDDVVLAGDGVDTVSFESAASAIAADLGDDAATGEGTDTIVGRRTSSAACRPTPWTATRVRTRSREDPAMTTSRAAAARTR